MGFGGHIGLGTYYHGGLLLAVGTDRGKCGGCLGSELVLDGSSFDRFWDDLARVVAPKFFPEEAKDKRDVTRSLG
ncbi:hypothetical protein D4S03_01685, partial [bacterium]